jgi:hypothetical protein
MFMRERFKDARVACIVVAKTELINSSASRIEFGGLTISIVRNVLPIV